jgi:hypothetical protein
MAIANRTGQPAQYRHVMKSDAPSSFEVLQAYLMARATFSAEDLAFIRGH